MIFVPLYKGVTLTVQGITLIVQEKYTKCTKIYKASIYENFQSIMNYSFIFLVTQGLYTHVIHFI